MKSIVLSKKSIYILTMGKKDSAEKLLEAHNDVFADIVNALLFGGEQIVKEDSLTDAQPFSSFKATGDTRLQERDVAKYWNEDCIRIGFCGIENQTAQDRDMALRVISYDGAAYRSQLSEKPQNKNKSGETVRYPVVTLVLYFGTEHRWSAAKSLHERLSINDRLLPFVSDYKMNLFELAWLSNEQISAFKSDFREVVEYLRSCRMHTRYEGSERELQHITEMLELFRAISGDESFKTIENEILNTKKEKGGIKMYDVFRAVKDEGIALGRNEGIALGRNEGITLGRNEGIALGRNEERTSLLSLFAALYAAGRADDVRKATSDQAYLQKLLDEYQK